MPRTSPFIPPMLPSPAPTPPVGDDWIHEAKLDGFRVQVHLVEGVAAIYSRNGSDFTKRFRALLPALARIPARSAVLDCELVACGLDGLPSFEILMSAGGKTRQICLWFFDVLQVDGVPMMALPLVSRRDRLQRLIAGAGSDRLQFSGTFEDPLSLLAAGERNGLEGVVSKRATSAYRPGRSRDWLKIKTASWRAANRDRWEMFRRGR